MNIYDDENEIISALPEAECSCCGERGLRRWTWGNGDVERLECDICDYAPAEGLPRLGVFWVEPLYRCGNCGSSVRNLADCVVCEGSATNEAAK
jgi:hypothetical protein